MTLRNPIIYGRIFNRSSNYEDPDSMTITGTAQKALILILLMILSGICSCYLLLNEVNLIQYLGISLVGSFVISFLTAFIPKISSVTSLLYAIANGMSLGVFSLLANYMYPGIVLNAVVTIIVIFFVTFLMYATRIVQMTLGLSLALSVSTIAIGFTYLCDLILGLFGINVPFIHENGWAGIGLSMMTITIAASNLFMDFSRIEQYAHNGHPKYMEWYAAFGLMLTITWMYIEMLRLLMKLAATRNK